MYKLVKLSFFFLVIAGCGGGPTDLSQTASEDVSRQRAYSEPDWSAEAELPAEGHRANIYNLETSEWQKAIQQGRKHALWYPVTVSGLMIPFEPIRRLLEDDGNPLTRLLGAGARVFSGIKSYDDMYAWLGLSRYPQKANQYGIPFPESNKPYYRMGATISRRHGIKSLTFSCATCHASQLFGRPVFGLTTRFSRANDFFRVAKYWMPKTPATVFQMTTGASQKERQVFSETKHHLRWVETKSPAAIGLDTSLAQVALSLARRELDPYATMTERSASHPRSNLLEHLVADSKPAVWWNLKYKTRWLSDGSIISGNPVHTNFLWNELGRATDLKKLETWLLANQSAVRDLTAAVFATEAPRYEDFMGAEAINIDLAKQGQQHFNTYCSRCHGTYEKGWNISEDSSASELIKTVRVNYHDRTPVVNVGTDSGRYRGMAGFADRLNELAISKSLNTVVEVQRGYVPPPLVGIWARWPYFHNNAAPSLCAVLTASSKRPRQYYAGEPINKTTDFDARCNGYPKNPPVSWTKGKVRHFDSSQPGLSNKGHDEGIFLKDGKELLSSEQKMSIIEFLKTL